MNKTTPEAARKAAQSAASPINHWIEQGRVDNSLARRGYVICSTPRTGSYFLCDLLRSTGCLGRPHEYFGGPAMRRIGWPDYPLDLAGQVAAVLRDGCTANGVFGAKLFAAQFERHGRKLFDKLGDPMLIFLEREDVLGQAISFTRAAQTDVYFAGDLQEEVPGFDAALIRDYLEQILRWNASWQLYFARSGIVPLRLSYEQMTADPQRTIDRISAALAVPGPVKIEPELLSTTIQRDETSKEWRERFLEAQRGVMGLETLRSDIQITLQRKARRVARMVGLRRN